MVENFKYLNKDIYFKNVSATSGKTICFQVVGRCEKQTDIK